MSEQGVFSLGAWRLHDGDVLPDAKLVYKTFGTLAADRSNAVLYGMERGDST